MTPKFAIAGANGWIGRSALRAILNSQQFENQFVLFTRSGDRISLGARELETRPLGSSVYENLQVEAFIQTAFLTREKALEVPKAQYETRNIRIIESVIARIREMRPKRVIFVSSGIVDERFSGLKGESYELYRKLKLTEIEMLKDATNRLGIPIVEGRLYSTTGEDMKTPHIFAFGDIVNQARGGNVIIEADGPVWRRYVDSVDFMTVLLKFAEVGSGQLLESGGELIEIRQLANLALKHFGFDNRLGLHDHARAGDDYFSKSSDFETFAKLNGIELKTTSDQVRNVAQLMS